MIGRLQGLWHTRTLRERRVLLILAILVAVALYVSLLAMAVKARPQLRTNVLSLRADAAQLEDFASELERLRTARAPVSSQTDLRTLVQAQADSSGIAGMLVRIDVQDRDRVQVVFGAIPFADWLNWVLALNVQNIRLETCRVEALAQPGLTSATAVLVRSGRP